MFVLQGCKETDWWGALYHQGAQDDDQAGLDRLISFWVSQLSFGLGLDIS